MPLGPRVPDLAALELLLAVADTGSLSGAARRVGVSQQAASSRLAAMETRTGVALVLRTPRGSALTGAGTVVAEWAARLLAVAEQLDAGLAALRADRSARLRVAASLTVAEHLLPGWLVSLQAEARHRGQTVTEVVLTATNSDAVVARVLAEEADLGFVETPDAPRGVHAEVVARDRLVVVVRPDHPWALSGRVDATRLAGTPLVSREAGSGTRDALRHALAVTLGAGVAQAPPALALSTTAAVRAAVRAGAGPAVLSELSVRDDLDDGRLVAVDVPEVDLSRALRAIWVGPRHPPAGPVRDLLAHVTHRPR